MTDNSGPAFPLINRDYQEAYGGCPGMSLRDYFAGQALVGILANPGTQTKNSETLKNLYKTAAEFSYVAADAMIAQRSK